jgi:hypothetical protein
MPFMVAGTLAPSPILLHFCTSPPRQLDWLRVCSDSPYSFFICRLVDTCLSNTLLHTHSLRLVFTIVPPSFLPHDQYYDT